MIVLFAHIMAFGIAIFLWWFFMLRDKIRIVPLLIMTNSIASLAYVRYPLTVVCMFVPFWAGLWLHFRFTTWIVEAAG